MKLKVEVVNDTQGDSLADLMQWIMADQSVRSLLRERRTHGTEEMGGALEAVELFLNETGTVAAVSAVIVTWMSSRIGKTKIRVRSGEREIEIDSSNPKKAQEIAEEIARILNSGE